MLSWFGIDVPAAAFGRLCVETQMRQKKKPKRQAAAFGRLCVETSADLENLVIIPYAAAFGWLCVETIRLAILCFGMLQPPSGGCVLKLII